MSSIWLDVEDGAGNRLGAGSIPALLGWEQRSRLSRMGRFSATIAAEVGAAARTLLQPLRVVHGWGMVQGERVHLGSGIIERVSAAADGTLSIEGDDLLRELTYRRVHGATIYDETLFTPTVMLESSGSFTLLTNATDGNPATYDAIALGATNDFLYIGLSRTFNRATLALSLGNGNSALAQWGFSNAEGGWREPIVSDGTVNAGLPLAQNGAVAFVRPGAWTRRVVNGLDRYWMRLDPSAALSTVRLNDVSVTVRTPAADDITQLMAYAPMGWSLDLINGYDGTTNGTQQSFAEETVLAALVKSAERTGEAFRLGAGRTVTWLRHATPASGVVAIADATAPDVATLLALTAVHDSESLVTRVYPYGAGNGAARLTLRDTTLIPPAGYTLNLGANALISTAAESSYGRIEGVLYLKEIRASDGSAAPDPSAGNDLFTAALAWLQQRDAPHRWFRLTVAGVAVQGIQVGDTFRILAHGVDETVIALECSTRVGEAGVCTIEILAGTVARFPQDDAELTAIRLSRAEAYMTHAQSVAETSVR